MRSLRPLFALPLLLAGCVNTDAAVFVEPTIESPTATFKGGALGVTISGNFTLKLHLGPRASGPSTVKLGAFSILDAGQKAAITSVQIGTTSTQFPVTVDLDSDVSASLPFDLGSKTLPEDPSKSKLCDPAGVVIGGTIEDSLLGGSTPFFSAIIHPAGCM
jgi:hypothetical protein